MFCDASGVTKAHVFPKSNTGLLEPPAAPRDHEIVHRYIDPVTGENREIKRAKTFALISRKVCQPCNGGWLRELEDRVRPLMADFATNTPIVLNASDQAYLALWATAASLIAMSMDPEAREFASSALPREIYRLRRPTPGIAVWLGANAHGEAAWFGSHSLNLRDAPGQRAWGATITFTYAVIHLICHDLCDQRIRLRGSAVRSLRRIWGPRDAVAWPPKLIMTQHDLSPLAMVVGEQCSFERAVRG